MHTSTHWSHFKQEKMVENDIPRFFFLFYFFQIIFIFWTVRFGWIYKTGPPLPLHKRVPALKKNK